MFKAIYNFIVGLFSRRPVRLAIVRRYADANGSYVGELYMERVRNGVSSYEWVGASLDTLPLETIAMSNGSSMMVGDLVDTRHDFLDPMPVMTIRVGAVDPQDNDRVRQMVARLPKGNMTLIIQNRFIEHVMERKA